MPQSHFSCNIGIRIWYMVESFAVSAFGTLLDKNALCTSPCLLELASIFIHLWCLLVNQLSHHGLSCLKSDRLAHHNSINCILNLEFASADILCLLEVDSLYRDNGKHPGGMTLILQQKWKTLVWDVTPADTYHIHIQVCHPSKLVLQLLWPRHLNIIIQSIKKHFKIVCSELSKLLVEKSRYLRAKNYLK